MISGITYHQSPPTGRRPSPGKQKVVIEFSARCSRRATVPILPPGERRAKGWDRSISYLQTVGFTTRRPMQKVFETSESVSSFRPLVSRRLVVSVIV